MSTITSIERERRGGRVAVIVDEAAGEPWVRVHREAVYALGLRVGQEASDDLRDRLEQEDARHRAYEASLHLLSYRPRSEQELRDRLRRKGLPAEAIAATVERLRGAGLLNDEQFARQWVAERGSGAHARGRSLLAAELRARGVRDAGAAAALSEVDDEAQVRAVARAHAAKLRVATYEEFYRRLGSFLQRRGFGYGVVGPIVRELWRERGGESAEDDE
ncbi:MAG TPA: RecX family transcriptional regulator [Dehalococcoidia bacterium]|nr:RecX family transcriptional regulator [Dehalococcoidia bacterium]